LSGKRHFVVLDGLRGIAAITVALGHLCQTMSLTNSPAQGQLAVDFFFMLSGFVVAYAYEHKLRTTMSFSQFSVIRLVRLYPMVFFGVAIGIISRLLDGASGQGVLPVLGAGVFAFLLLPVPRRSAVPVSAFPLNGPLWSLTYELISNLAYAAAIRWLSTRVLAVLVAILSVVLYVVLRIEHGVQASVAWGPELLYGFPRVFVPFILGVLLFRLGGPFRPGSTALSLLAALGLGAVLWAPTHDNANFDIVAILIVFPILMLVAARSPDDGPLAGIWTVLGKLSYPVYAINQPVFRIGLVVAKRAHVSDAMLPWFSVASFGLCLVLGYAILVLYDEPVRRALSRKFIKRDAQPKATAIPAT
jgi:peptidoglycan/LPS O-acetylase OafA/YrhL